MESSGDSPGMLQQLGVFTSQCDDKASPLHTASSHHLSSSVARFLKWQLKALKGKCSKREKVQVISPLKGQTCDVISAHSFG